MGSNKKQTRQQQKERLEQQLGKRKALLEEIQAEADKRWEELLKKAA